VLDDTHNLRNDITSATNYNGIAYTDVLSPHFVDVV
jgi:hypothetical protein